LFYNLLDGHIGAQLEEAHEVNIRSTNRIKDAELLACNDGAESVISADGE
jgi:hypothetical protein